MDAWNLLSHLAPIKVAREILSELDRSALRRRLAFRRLGQIVSEFVACMTADDDVRTASLNQHLELDFTAPRKLHPPAMQVALPCSGTGGYLQSERPDHVKLESQSCKHHRADKVPWIPGDQASDEREDATLPAAARSLLLR